MARTLPDLLDEQVEQRPDALALVAGDERLSYQELRSRSLRAASVLTDLGASRGSRIALVETNTALWHEISFGALRLGAVVDAFNTWIRAYDLEHLLGASKAEILVLRQKVGTADLLEELRKTDPAAHFAAGKVSSARYPHLHTIVLLDDEGSDHSWQALMAAASAPALPSAAQPDDPAFILYTSGSTKYPKAVPLLHGKMIDNSFSIGERMGLGSEDRVWLGSPLFWSYGIANAAMATMTHGACLVLQERFEPVAAAELMEREACTAAYLLPSLVDALSTKAGEKVRSIASLRTGLTIGRPDEVRRIVDELSIDEICTVYGSTETYGNCCVTHHTMSLDERLFSQGYPLYGVEVRVVDPMTGALLPRGEAGEIQVRGNIMPGYIGDPELTTETMAEDGWFRSGDTGLINEAGCIRFVARHSEMIKTSGINVSPAEVEGFYSRHPGIEDIAVVGAPHPVKGEVVVAFVIAHEPGLTADEVVAFGRGQVAGYKVPSLVILEDAFPRTSTGKLDRKALVKKAAESVEQTLDR